MTDQTGVLPGTLDLLILKAVSLGKLHGYGVLLRIEQISGGALQIQQGALYPALYRLEHQGVRDHRVAALDLAERPDRAGVVGQGVVREEPSRDDVGAHGRLPPVLSAATTPASSRSSTAVSRRRPSSAVVAPRALVPGHRRPPARWAPRSGPRRAALPGGRGGR